MVVKTSSVVVFADSRFHVDRPYHDGLCLVVCLVLSLMHPHADEPVVQAQSLSQVQKHSGCRFIGIGFHH